MTETTSAARPVRAAPSETSLRDLWSTLRRRRGIVFGTALIAVVLTMAMTFYMRPLYSSEAVVRIVAEKAASGGMLKQLGAMTGLGALTGLGEDDIDTDLGIMRSRLLADPIVDSLGMQVVLRSPREVRSSVLRVLAAPRDSSVGVYELTRRADGSYSASVVKRPEEEGPVALPGRVVAGTPFRVGAVELALLPSRGGAAPERVRFEIVPFRQAVNALQEGILVDRQDPGSRLVAITYQDRDPRLAADVVNRLSNAFIGYKHTTSTRESNSSATELREQVASYQMQLATAEERLKDFRESQRVIAPEAQATADIRRSGEMAMRFDEMRVQRESLGRLLAEVRAAPPGRGTAVYRKLSTFPAFAENEAVSALVTKLSELDSERTTLLVRRTEQDEDVRTLDAQIVSTEREILRIASDFYRSLELQLDAADGAVARVGAQMALLPANDMQFMRLTRDVKMLNEVYLLLQARLKEAEITEAVTQDAAEVVDYGLVAREPDSPRPLLNLLLSVVLGLLAGVAAAIARDLVDPTVRSSRDAEEATGGLVVLGSIPRIAPAARRGAAAISGWPRALVHRPRAHLVAQSDPRHPASEAYRALRTSLAHLVSEQAPRTLVVTSARAGEGKSTSAANLAVTLARQGTRTLLVDADLRTGRLHALFGLRPEPGLAEVLTGSRSLAEAVIEVPIEGLDAPLHLLPAGAMPHNPAELLGAAGTAELMLEMRERFDIVIFDAPALEGFTDAAVLGKAADATVLVVRPGTTDRDALESALARLRLSRVPVAGLVLNDVLAANLG